MVKLSRGVSPLARWPVFGAVLLALAWGVGGGAHEPSQDQREKANKELVLQFAAAMQAQDIDKAAAFLAPDYIQHNPFIPPGKAGFVQFFSKLWRAGPASVASQAADPPVLLVAEKDLVVVAFRRPRPEPGDATKSYDSFWFDAYRIANGKLVEHWDPLTKPQASTSPQP